MVKRNTKQRSGIKDFLMTRKDHPTAEVVYEEMKKVIPNISLGTVYRNLHELSDSGEILKLRFDDGKDHFDATTAKHYHFICRSCGSVYDIFDVDDRISIKAEKLPGEVDGHFVYFYGKCANCKDVKKAV